MPTRYGRSPWIDQFPKSRVPTYPAHRGPLKVDAVIVGGGLTGCVTAYAFAAAGIKVALFEADALGRGASGASTGWIADDPGISFVEVEKLVGRAQSTPGVAGVAARRARFRRAHSPARISNAISSRVGRCSSRRRRNKRPGSGANRRSRRDAGFDAVVDQGRRSPTRPASPTASGCEVATARRSIPIARRSALRRRRLERGALIFEHSAVRKIGFNRKDAEVFTSGGIVSNTTRRDRDGHADADALSHRSPVTSGSRARISRSPIPFPRKSAIVWASVRPSFATPPRRRTSSDGWTMSGC